jgi:hypothetical protein
MGEKQMPLKMMILTLTRMEKGKLQHAKALHVNHVKSNPILMYAEGGTILYKRLGLTQAQSLVLKVTSLIVTRN